MRAIPYLAILLLAACGAQLGDGTDHSVSTRPDAAAMRNPDAAVQQPDASLAIVDNACGVASDQGDLGMLAGTAGSQVQDATTTLRVSWVQSPNPQTATQPSPDVVTVELWDGFGVFTNGVAHSGTFTLTGAETDYDTCGVCVLMFADVTNNAPTKLLLATAGTVTITSVGTAAGQTTQATVSNASFVEIASVPNQGYQTVATSSCASPISHADLHGTL